MTNLTLVGLLEVFTFILNVSQQFGGITFVAWGNSVGDLITDRSIALQGDPQSAVTACFAGPVFNILWSFGMIMFIKAMVSLIVGNWRDFQKCLITSGLLFGCVISAMYIDAPTIIYMT